MIRIEEKGNIVYSVAEKELTNEDYEKLIPLLQEKIKKYSMIRWYFEMNDFKGWSLSAAWKDLKFDARNEKNLEKIAMVGDKDWEEKLAKLMKPFTGADVKFFPLVEKDEAKSWISKSY